MKTISIIIPCYNEAENINELHSRIKKVFTQIPYNYELIFVDNASTDNSKELFKTLISQNKNITALIMSRNFGTSQSSLLAGIQYATGDATVLIEADLQDPPELISKFIKKWEDGFDVVYAIRKKRKGNIVRRFFYKCFYRIFKWLSYLKIPLDSGDFSLLDKKVTDIIKKLPEKDVYIRGLRTWAGFKQIGIEYIRNDRAHGKTSIQFFDNFSWAKKAIVNFSYKPLEFISKLAIITAIITIFAAICYLYFYLKTDMPKGFATLLMIMFIFGTIQLLALSIIGEYMIRIFQEIKGRPSYIISEILNQRNIKQ